MKEKIAKNSLPIYRGIMAIDTAAACIQALNFPMVNFSKKKLISEVEIG
ncbi:MAG: hypothetical protein ABSF13_06230 [Smithella sp.]|jgi:hypothetical protein